MNSLHWLFDSSLVQRLGWTLLHSIWEDAAVAVLLAAMLLAFRRSNSQSRYLVGCAAMLMMLAAPLITFGLLKSPAPLAPDVRPPQAAARTMGTPDLIPHGTAPLSIAQDSSSHAVTPQAPQSQATPPVAEHQIPRTPAAISPTPERHWSVSLLSHALPWIVLTWAGGVLILSIWNLGGWLWVRQLRHAATRPVSSDLERLLAPLVRKLAVRRPVRLLKSALAQTPLVIGILRPIILLPASVLNELSISELESILSHELAHIRRHDYLVNLIQSLIETLLFYHPAVWWVSQRIRIERENCCDDLVLSLTPDRGTYARALAAVASVRVPALAPAASGGRLLIRLRRIAGAGETDSVGLSRWLAGATVILLCLAAALLVTRSASGAGNQQSNKPATQPGGAVAASDDVVRVRGRVLGPDGKPRPGARILAFGNAWDTVRPLSESQSGADGEFEIEFRKSQFAQKLGDWKITGIAALVPGLPTAWARWDQTDASGQVVLKLTRRDTPIEGRILNTEGRGIPGVKVHLMRVEAKAVDLTKLNASEIDESAVPDGRPLVLLPGYATGQPTEFTTDKDGRFRVEGIGSDRTVSFDMGGPTMAMASIDVVTRDERTVSRKFQRYLQVTETTYGAKFDFTAVPERPVRGTVTDAATGKPLKGFTVEPNVWTSYQRTITDEQGHFEIHGLVKGQDQKLRVLPPAGEPYLIAEGQIPASAGYAPVTMDFKIDKGIWITGKVKDLATGVPVMGARVHYRPYRSNAYAQQTSEYAQNQIPEPFPGYETDANGRYRLVAVPGPALVDVNWAHQSYRHGVGASDIKCPKAQQGFYLTYEPWIFPKFVMAVKEVDVPPGVQSTNVDLQLDPGFTIQFAVVGPDGKPADDINVYGMRPGFPIEKLSSSTFDAVAFEPNEQRQISVWDAHRRIGKVVHVRPSDAPDHKVTIKLQPWSEVTGRLVGPDGQAVTNARIETQVDSFFPGGTDAKGRFHIRLLPGMDCSLRGIKGREEFNTDAQHVPIRPGETKDLGDVHMKSFS